VSAFSQEELRALALAFPESAAVRGLLGSVGFPLERLPVWNAGSAAEVWYAIAERLSAGVIPDGRARVLAAAAASLLFLTKPREPRGGRPHPPPHRQSKKRPHGDHWGCSTSTPNFCATVTDLSPYAPPCRRWMVRRRCGCGAGSEPETAFGVPAASPEKPWRVPGAVRPVPIARRLRKILAEMGSWWCCQCRTS